MRDTVVETTCNGHGLCALCLDILSPERVCKVQILINNSYVTKIEHFCNRFSELHISQKKLAHTIVYRLIIKSIK